MINLIIIERIKKWVTFFNNPCQDFFKTSYLQTLSSYGISLLGLILRPCLKTLLQRFNHRFDLRLQINLYVTEIFFDVFSKFGS